MGLGGCVAGAVAVYVDGAAEYYDFGCYVCFSEYSW